MAEPVLPSDRLTAIVASLAERHGVPAGDPEPLDGGFTNRNFRVRFGGEDCVVRLVGKDTGLLGISREGERQATAAAAELGIAPEVLAAGEGYLVTRYVPGTTIDPAALRADPAPIARALRAFHGSGVRLPTRFWVPELLEAYAAVIARRRAPASAELATAQELVARIAAVVPLQVELPCHNDLLAGNIIRRPEGRLTLVDWEYAGMGHHLFDLGNLAVNNELDGADAERLLTAYDGRAPSVGRQAALALMRLVSDAREAAWGAVQGAISELDVDYADYAGRHFARLLAAAEDSRFADWLEVADGSSP